MTRFYENSGHVVEPAAPAAQPQAPASPPATQQPTPVSIPPSKQAAEATATQTSPKPFYANSQHEAPKAQDTYAKPAEPKPLYKETAEPYDPLNEHVPEAIRELRQADADRKMFSPQTTFKDALRDDAFKNAEGFSDADKARAVAEWRECFADLGLPPADASQLVRLYGEVGRNPPDEATLESWRAQSLKRLGELHGEANVVKVLKQTNDLVKRDPRISKVLVQSGLGSHPEVVELLVQRAQQERVRGRLK